MLWGVGGQHEVHRRDLGPGAGADADGPRPVAVVISADAGANAAKMADLMGRVTKLAQEDKADVKTESFAGASLTVNDVRKAEDGSTRLSVNIIPHTAASTTLGELAAGQQLNVEFDVLARYLDRMLQARTQ